MRTGDFDFGHDLSAPPDRASEMLLGMRNGNDISDLIQD
jgi:hypothetical protein